MSKKRLKLKGQNVKRLGKAQKAKMEKTLKRMEKTRQIDSDNLRDLIKQKLNWAIQEKVKGLKQINNLKIQVARLEGIIFFINDLIKPSEKEKKK